MKTKNIILGAGYPIHGTTPSFLEEFFLNENVIEWCLHSLSAKYDNTYLVAGYQSDSICELKDKVKIIVNNEWKTSGSVFSLSKIPFSSIDFEKVDSVIISYGDILFRDVLIEKLQMSKYDISIAYDSKPNYSDINNKKIESVAVKNSKVVRAGKELPDYFEVGQFIGLVKIQGDALIFLKAILETLSDKLKNASIIDLIELFRCEGFYIDAIEGNGYWAEIGADTELVRFILGTKAETLSRLKKIVKNSYIQDQISFNVEEWKKESRNIIDKIKDKFGWQPLIIRSSARSEDSFCNSNAGAYTSLLNVQLPKLESSIEEVINSYNNCQLDDQVLVQPMLQDVTRCGVAFTRTLEHGAPYYVINYDESGFTDGITAGDNNDHRTLVISRDTNVDNICNKELIPVIKALKEIEDILNYTSLDIEFAMDKHGDVYIFQVRPITLQSNDIKGISELCMKEKVNSEKYWHQLSIPFPQIVGSKSIYGVMPDWNPAEIIGTNPNKLAESLYKYLILDETWATQRAEYGYRDIRPAPLLVSFSGKPYIDVRASFNSFIPQTISDESSCILVDFYSEWLLKNPNLHDKIEFGVLPTCYGPSFSKWKERLSNEGKISDNIINELAIGLLSITNNAISKTSNYLSDIEKLDNKISKRYLKENKFPPTARNIKFLLDECRLYGTLPFAHLARSGFIAVTLLKEGVNEDWLSKNAYENFMMSLRTVSHELTEDAQNVVLGKCNWEQFVHDYGHLRPGTYDITSPAYSDDPEKFLKPLIESISLENNSIHKPTKDNSWDQEKKFFFSKLQELGIDFNGDEIEKFLRNSIEGRERAKFLFSKNLSESLDLIADLSNSIGLTLEETSNLSIYDILNMIDSSVDIKLSQTLLKKQSMYNKRNREVSIMCELPPLITDVSDFSSFELTSSLPNFIGTKRIISECIHLVGFNDDTMSFKDKIVLIPQADPGYDWLFGQGISGLITLYGGANSHMAIRSAEFGLPAAIGVGEQLFKELSVAKVVELDPINDVIRVIR